MSRGFLFPSRAGRVSYDNTDSGLTAEDVQEAIDEVAGTAGAAVPQTRTITAGAGLTGGGDLSANRTIDVAAADGSITVNANSIQVALSADTPQPIGTAAAGVAVTPSRGDHVHADPWNPFGSVDPTAGAGVAANRGAIYHRDNGSAYLKTGAGDTEWRQLVTQVFADLVTVDRLAVALPGSAAAPAVDISDGTAYGQGVYCEAADTLSMAANGIRNARTRSTNTEFLNAPVSFTQFDVGSGVQTSALSANTDNLALTAVGKLTLTSSGGPFNLTGLTNGTAGGGTGGRRLWIENNNALGGDNVILVHDATSTAANRFFFAGGANFTLVPGAGAWFRYNNTASRWYKAE